MSFAPTIVLAGAQNVILGELPPDAKLAFTVNRRDCKMLQYRSALVRKALQGRWDVLVALYSGDTAKPYNDLAISDILFSNNTPGDRSIQC